MMYLKGYYKILNTIVCDKLILKRIQNSGGKFAMVRGHINLFEAV